MLNNLHRHLLHGQLTALTATLKFTASILDAVNGFRPVHVNNVNHCIARSTGPGGEGGGGGESPSPPDNLHPPPLVRQLGYTMAT